MRNFNLLFFASVILVFAVAFGIPETVTACPNCKDGLGGNPTSQAFAMSILLMMSMPFILGACWIAAIVILRREV